MKIFFHYFCDRVITETLITLFPVKRKKEIEKVLTTFLAMNCQIFGNAIFYAASLHFLFYKTETFAIERGYLSFIIH